ncbi:MAG TPA: DNA-processing protein DprA [Paucimonas sp.]|nr:DNA-processing protein DprA [Paucimonas sp.]
MTDLEGLAAWIRLEQTAGLGLEGARKLLAAFGLPENIFGAGYAALARVVPERVARALTAAPSEATLALIERSLEWAEQPGNHILTLADDGYPQTLLDIPDPPLMVYAKGRIELLARPSIAIVGSRNATAQGVANAEKFSEVLSQAGLTIVSGMALGIDTAAHQGGLRGPGATVAVIGTGADLVYPARNRGLAHLIAEGGCIVSEYSLGTPALAANFPRRNRVISGLARGVLVVEAAIQSGSLITARMAAEQGREVFAIPGSIHSPLAKGCHRLIKQGAKLVESAEDILEEFRYYQAVKAGLPAIQATPAPAAPSPAAMPVTDPLLEAMGFDPVPLDALAMRCGLDAATLSARLLGLELDGRIEVLPGGSYRRLA